MITGELKNKIDGLWDIFAAGGLVNPLDVVEQITYLMFIRDLDDADKETIRFVPVEAWATPQTVENIRANVEFYIFRVNSEFYLIKTVVSAGSSISFKVIEPVEMTFLLHNEQFF